MTIQGLQATEDGLVSRTSLQVISPYATTLYYAINPKEWSATKSPLLLGTVKTSATRDVETDQYFDIDMTGFKRFLIYPPVGLSEDRTYNLYINLSRNTLISLSSDTITTLLPKDKKTDYLLFPGSGYLPVFGEIDPNEADSLAFDFRKSRTVHYTVKDRQGNPCLTNLDQSSLIYCSFRAKPEIPLHYDGYFFRMTQIAEPLSVQTSADGSYNYAVFHALPSKQHFWIYKGWLHGIDGHTYDFENKFIGHSHFTVEEGTGTQDVALDFSKFHELTVRFTGLENVLTKKLLNYHIALNNPNEDFRLFANEELMDSENYDAVREGKEWVDRRLIGPQFTSIDVTPIDLLVGDTLLMKPAPRTIPLLDDTEIVFDLSGYRPVTFIAPRDFFKTGRFIVDDMEVRTNNPQSRATQSSTTQTDTIVVYMPQGEHTWKAIVNDSTVVMPERTFTVGEETQGQQQTMTDKDFSGIKFIVKSNSDTDINLNGEDISLDMLAGEKLHYVERGTYTWSLNGGYVPIEGRTHGTLEVADSVTSLYLDLTDFHELKVSRNGMTFENIRYIDENGVEETFELGLTSQVVDGDTIPCRRCFASSAGTVAFDLIIGGSALGTRYPLSIELLKDSVMILPDRPYRIKFMRDSISVDITTITIDAVDGPFKNIVPIRPRGNSMYLITGHYKATTSEGETAYFEVADSTMTVDFAKQPDMPSGIENINGVNSVREVGRYAIDGSRLTTPHKGLNIVLYSDGTHRKELVK